MENRGLARDRESRKDGVIVGTWYDLSQPFFDDMPRGHRLVASPRLKRILLTTHQPPLSSIQITDFHILNHVGTHVDAPRHVFTDGDGIGDIAIDRFTGPGVIIDVPCTPMQSMGVADISARVPGISNGDIVFLRTGWGGKFRPEARAEYLQWPYLEPEVADWLLGLNVRMLGVDTASPDPPRDAVGANRTLPIHRKLLGEGVPIVENLNLEALYGCRCSIFAFPLNLVTGDGGPTRAVARREQALSNAT